jgi:ribose transport system substrate-binding protein
MGGKTVKLRIFRGLSGLAVAATFLASATVGAPSMAQASTKTIHVAYLSFAVSNSYDAPMLAAAKAVAAADNVAVTVFDANNNPATQYTQLQDVITSGRYQGIITQPVVSTNLIPLVRKAITKGIKVVNIDQILGTSYTTDQSQVPGLSANVVFLPSRIGTQLGDQVITACGSKSLNPCNVAYMYNIKGSTLDTAIYNAFNKVVKADPKIHQVANGSGYFTISLADAAVSNILQANPNLNLIVGADQSIEGAQVALASSQNRKILFVAFGGSAAAVTGVKSGAWFSDVAQAPATEGQDGMIALVAAVSAGKTSGMVDPVAHLPHHGVITKSDATQFTAEWPG